jgi:hypothetical protein
MRVTQFGSTVIVLTFFLEVHKNHPKWSEKSILKWPLATASKTDLQELSELVF